MTIILQAARLVLPTLFFGYAIFANLSPRVVQQMRDEIETRGKVAAKDADDSARDRWITE